MNGLPDFSFEDELFPIEEAIPPTEEAVAEPDKEVEESGEDNNTDDIPDEEFTEKLKSHYNLLKAKGYLQHEGEFDGTPEQYDEILSANRELEKQQYRTSFLETIPEKYRPLATIMINKGENLSAEDFQQYLEMSTSELTEQDFDDSEVAEAFMRGHLEGLGESADAIDEEIDNLKTRGVLSSRTKALFKQQEAVNQQLLKKAAEESKAEYDNTMEGRKKYDDTFSSTIESSKWRKDFQKTVKDEYKKGTYRQKLLTVVKDPSLAPYLAAFMAHFDLDKKTFNLKSFANAAASGGTNLVKQQIQQALESSSGHTGGSRIPKNAGKEEIYTFDGIDRF